MKNGEGKGRSMLLLLLACFALPLVHDAYIYILIFDSNDQSSYTELIYSSEKEKFINHLKYYNR